MRVKCCGCCFSRNQTDGQGVIALVVLGGRAGRRGQLQAQVVPREVVQIVEGMLGESKQVLGLLLLERVGLDGYAQGEDGTTGLGEA